MNRTSFDANWEDELLPEYEFDYAKAKPNRFAMPELPIEQQQEGDRHIRQNEATSDSSDVFEPIPGDAQ